MFLWGGKSVVALDIGSTALKLIELASSRDTYTLQNFTMVPMPQGVMSGGEIADPGALSEVIKGAVAAAKSKRKSASVGLWGAAVVVKRISMARMDTKLIPEQIRFEAEQYIPFDLNNVNLDYAVLKDSGGENMDVLLIGAQKELIIKYIESVESAGLKCSIIDVEGFAVANCFNINYSLTNEVIALLNIGASKTNMVVLQNGEAIFCRDVLVGGYNHSADISKVMGITIEEAEALKISACRGKEAPTEVLEAIKGTNEVVVEEIHRTFDFFAATVPDTAVNRVFVTGGGSLTKGLVESLKSTLQIEVEPLNVFKKVAVTAKLASEFDTNFLNSVLAVGIGLGCRQIGDK